VARIIARIVSGRRFTVIPYGSRGTSIAEMLEDDYPRFRVKVRRWRDAPGRWSKARWVCLADCSEPPAGDPRIDRALEGG
jgi:hypothetical protein